MVTLERLVSTYRTISVRIGPYNVSVLTFASYLVDWFVYLLILFTGVGYGLVGEPREVEFDAHNRGTMYKYVPESEAFAPIYMLVVFSVLVPMVLDALLTFAFFSGQSLKRRLWNYHCSVLAQLGAISFELFCVSCIKNVASVPRPDFLDRCKPATVGPVMTHISACTGDPSLLHEGLRSFPSAHSSSIFAASTVQALYSSGVVGLHDGSGMSWKFVVAVLYPVTVSIVIASSRVSDHRHRVLDVVGGAVIGLVTGFTSFTIYFPLLSGNHRQEHPGRAYPPRRLCDTVHHFWYIDDPSGEQASPEIRPETVELQPSLFDTLTSPHNFRTL